MMGDKPIAAYGQNVVLDNGMSYAMAPQKSFIQLIKTLAEDYGLVCQKS